MQKKQYNALVDIFKYFCAIMIVDSHVRLINYDKSFLFDLFRYALYFFHVSFGYYYMKGLIKDSDSTIKKNIKRLLIVLVFWMIIYLPINFYNEVLSGKTDISSFVILQLKSLFINGTGFHLWFLASLIIYVIIGGLLYKNNKYRILYPISVDLYVIGLLGTYYYVIGNNIPILNILFNNEYFTTYCRLFLHGLPLFVMGIYIAEKEESLIKIDNKKLGLYSLVLFILSLIEIYISVNILKPVSNICSLFMYLLTFPLFILFIKNPKQELSEYGKVMKYISSFMYYSHPLFRTIMASLLMRLFNIDLSMLMMSIIVVILCSIFGYIFYKIDNKYLNKVLS